MGFIPHTTVDPEDLINRFLLHHRKDPAAIGKPQADKLENPFRPFGFLGKGRPVNREASPFGYPAFQLVLTLSAFSWETPAVRYWQNSSGSYASSSSNPHSEIGSLLA